MNSSLVGADEHLKRNEGGMKKEHVLCLKAVICLVVCSVACVGSWIIQKFHCFMLRDMAGEAGSVSSGDYRRTVVNTDFAGGCGGRR